MPHERLGDLDHDPTPRCPRWKSQRTVDPVITSSEPQALLVRCRSEACGGAPPAGAGDEIRSAPFAGPACGLQLPAERWKRAAAEAPGSSGEAPPTARARDRRCQAPRNRARLARTPERRWGFKHPWVCMVRGCCGWSGVRLRLARGVPQPGSAGPGGRSRRATRLTAAGNGNPLRGRSPESQTGLSILPPSALTCCPSLLGRLPRPGAGFPRSRPVPFRLGPAVLAQGQHAPRVVW
jgi:hypothetical protein